MKDLRVTIIQTTIFWENVQRNLLNLDEITASIPVNSTDLLILPEMFNTGFTMNAVQCFETMDGPTIQWMMAKSAEKNCVITGSLIIHEDGKFYNRLIWMKPDGTFATYDKRHLFRMAKEDEIFTAGTQKLVVEYKGWRICPLICYDLRFPVWSRNRNEYDLLIYVANWPERRAFAWKQLLIARAIENQSYVIGLNRVGTDFNGIDHSGDSVILDYLGTSICALEPFYDTVRTAELSFSKLQKYKNTFPAALDADNFELIP